MHRRLHGAGDVDDDDVARKAERCGSGGALGSAGPCLEGREVHEGILACDDHRRSIGRVMASLPRVDVVGCDGFEGGGAAGDGPALP